MEYSIRVNGMTIWEESMMQKSQRELLLHYTYVLFFVQFTIDYSQPPNIMLPDIFPPMRVSEHKFPPIQYSIYHHCQHTATNCAEQKVLYRGLTVFSLFGSSFPSNRYSFSVWRVFNVKHLLLLGLVQLDLCSWKSSTSVLS